VTATAQAGLFDATPEVAEEVAHTLPPPGAEIIVHEHGFGGREVRGVVLADPDTGEIMTQPAGNGTPMAAVEEADGRTTFVAWLAGRPDLVTYEVISGEDKGAAEPAPAPEHVPNEQEVFVPNEQEAAPPPPPAPDEPAPLTWAELDREAGRDPDKRPPWEVPHSERSRESVPNDREQQAPQASGATGGGHDLEDALMTAQKRVGAAQRREDAALKAYHEAQNAYMQAEEGSAAEVKAREVVRDRMEALAAAQDATKAARRETVGTVTGGLNLGGIFGGDETGEMPSWVIPALVIVGAVLVLGPLGLLAGAAVIWSPVRALLTGK
jgi:hypothetical protein